VAAWCRRSPDGALLLSLHIQPGAKRSEVAGLHGDSLRVRIAAPAVDDKANAALLAYLADRFDVPKRNVTLLSGERSREKRVQIVGTGVDPASLLAS
jgi:uncharacterized protein (TIGR00251 family)